MDASTQASQIRAQYARNLAQLSGMLAEAQKRAPKRYRGYTVAELNDAVALYTSRLAESDEALIARCAVLFGLA
jgi:hypothetical protein